MNRTTWYLALLLILGMSTVSSGQLRITEVMYDTAAEEGSWEWFELLNAGDSTVDLDGYVFDDFSMTNNAMSAPNIVNIASGGNAAVTELPAGGVAVVYNGGDLDYDESRFRNAWKLGNSVTLIGVSDFESLNNGGDTFGIWASFADYESDLANTDDDEQLEVSNFTAATAWIDYAAEGWPSASEVTIEWNGTGNYQDGSNWFANTEETAGVVTSAQTQFATAPINSQDDLASPGMVSGIGEANGLVITEILYNPASDQPSEWEFIEILNGTGVEIDFASTPYFFDDKASGPLSEPNIRQGVVGDGEIAVLFRDSTAIESMQAAWGEDINFIPVSAWSALNNGDDTIGLWDSVDSYLLDSPADGDRTFDEAVVTLTYGLDDWPMESDGQSINVIDVEAELDDPTNWTLSTVENGARSPELVLSSSLIDHVGGDLGTPGSFGDVMVGPTPTFDLDVNDDGSVNADDAALLCDAVGSAGISVTDALAENGILQGDADLNGRVEFADFLALSSGFGGDNAHFGNGDFDCNGAVVFADFLTLSSNFGSSSAAAAVPEPSGYVLVYFALLAGLSRRKSKVDRVAVA